MSTQSGGDPSLQATSPRYSHAETGTTQPSQLLCVGMIVNLVNTFDLDFIIPISLIDENMKRAHEANAVVEQKFWFKTSIYPNEDFDDSYKTNKLEESDWKKSSDNSN